ncbi:hypothetical protein HIO72_01350 [Halomonas sp. PA5]|nr:hypothetical protein HIO72_01350 [Halomonas sp. PA5]
MTPTAKAASENEERQARGQVQEKHVESATVGGATRGAAPSAANGEPLTPEELDYLERLKVTDRAVRQHEMAHQIAGGHYSGGASYEYEIGPDGKRYAVAGEVSIDYGPVSGDPQATIDKMQTVIAAALAPADPSTQDRKVAAQARQVMISARLELEQQRSEMNAARHSASEGGDDVAAASAGRGADRHAQGHAQESIERQLEEYEVVSRSIMAGQSYRDSLRAVA